MKTERLILRITPDFKRHLVAEAAREEVSVAELIRSRFDRSTDDDEETLVTLTAELRKAISVARKSLREGLAEAESALTELRSNASIQPKASRRSNSFLRNKQPCANS